MPSFAVIEHLNVFKNSQLCLLTGSLLRVMTALGFQGMEAAFSRGIIPAVPFTAPAAHKPVAAKRLLELHGGILAPTITMHQPTGSRPALEGRHQQGIVYPHGRHA